MWEYRFFYFKISLYWATSAKIVQYPFKNPWRQQGNKEHNNNNNTPNNRTESFNKLKNTIILKYYCKIKYKLYGRNNAN
jgi:hypothetical protein